MPNGKELSSSDTVTRVEFPSVAAYEFPTFEVPELAPFEITGESSLPEVGLTEPRELEERIRLAEKSLMEAKEYMRRNDPGQASEKLYKATEECIKFLAEQYGLPEVGEARKEGQWWTKLLGRSSKDLAGMLGKEEISDAWAKAYDLHVLGFHENAYNIEHIRPIIPLIENLVNYTKEVRNA